MPGGPARSRLCPPAAASSSARRARDRQVESGTLLLQLGRGESDGRLVPGPLELRGLDAASDSLLGLLAGAVDETDKRERRHAALHVRLDLDPARFEADESKGDRAREHPSKLRHGLWRLCADSASTN